MLSKKLISLYLAISLVMLMICVEYTGIPIILPVMTKALHLTMLQIQWSLILYLVPFVAFMVLAGRLGDIYGYRPILLMGLIIFGLASFGCGLATAGWQILIMRILQGIGGALMWPNSIALILNNVPKEQKGVATGVISGAVGFAMAIGPFLAGSLSILSWRWFFLINVAIVIFLSLFVFLSQELVEKRKQGSLDMVGAVMLSMVLIGLISAIYQHGWLAILLIILVSILLISFIIVENRIKEPLVKLSLFKQPEFFVSSLMRCLINLVFYILVFVSGLYLQFILGYSAMQAGVIFLPMTLIIGICSPIGGKIVDVFGANKTIVVGLILLLLGYLLIINLTSHVTWSLLLLSFLLIGLGYAAFSPAVLSNAMKFVPVDEMGVASGIFYMMGVIGSLIGVGVTGYIINFYNTTILASLQLAFPRIIFFCITIIFLSLIMFMATKIKFKKELSYNEQ